MASKCTPVTVHAEMSKILMAYRRAIHPATGKSPAMLMFGRQIQSRLDLLIPNDDVNNQLRILPSKQFVVGERVAVRDYLSKVKWRYGTVEKICGELHYDVKLDDGRMWRRHLDQIRKSAVNENTNANSDTTATVKDPIPVPAITNNASVSSLPLPLLQQPQLLATILTTPADQMQDTNSTQTDAEVPEETSNIENATSTPGELRRSKRQRKVPQRLVDHHLEFD